MAASRIQTSASVKPLSKCITSAGPHLTWQHPRNNGCRLPLQRLRPVQQAHGMAIECANQMLPVSLSCPRAEPALLPCASIQVPVLRRCVVGPSHLQAVTNRRMLCTRPLSSLIAVLIFSPAASSQASQHSGCACPCCRPRLFLQ